MASFKYTANMGKGAAKSATFKNAQRAAQESAKKGASSAAQKTVNIGKESMHFGTFAGAQKSAKENAKIGAKFVGKKVVPNLKKELGTDAKTIGTNLGKGAIGSAVGGAVIGAGINTVRGENAWDGAKTGAMLGGGFGVAKTGMRAGLGITGQAEKTIAGETMQMSRSVKNHLRAQRNSQTWTDVMEKSMKQKWG